MFVESSSNICRSLDPCCKIQNKLTDNCACAFMKTTCCHLLIVELLECENQSENDRRSQWFGILFYFAGRYQVCCV